MESKLDTKTLILFSFSVSFLIIVGFGWKMRMEEQALAEHGIVAEATVINKEIKKVRRDGREKKKYCIDLTFESSLQQKAEHSKCIGKSQWQNMEKDQKTPVFYDPENTSNFVLGTTAPTSSMSDILFIVAALDLLIGFGIYTYFKRKSDQNNQKSGVYHS